MNVFLLKVDGGNFGDDMNEWFWSELFPDHSELAPGTTLFGIGSILWAENLRAFPRIVVMGSGSGYGNTPDVVPPNTDIGWVRGPRTAKRLGLSRDKIITDPACMLSKFKMFSRVRYTGERLFIPHVGTARLALNWERIAAESGTTYLSPSGNSKEIIHRIAGADLVVAESLHAAIVADAFRVPWIPISISPTFNSHKWLDWAESLRMTEMDFAPCLAGLKRLYSLRAQGFRVLQSLKGIVRGTKDEKAQAAGWGSRDGKLSDKEKEQARRLFVRFSGTIGDTISDDIGRAIRGRMFLSHDRVLERRQLAIEGRIEEARRRLSRASSGLQ